jgi:hypothetical protein
VLGTVPNPGLLNSLGKRYYAEAPDSERERVVSSHWREHSSNFVVEFDSEANLVSLSGGEFGVCRWNNLNHQAMDRLCILSHFLHLGDKRGIVRAMGAASTVCGRMGFNPTLDVFRQACSLALISRHISREKRSGKLVFLMIGDGFGVLSAMTKIVFPRATVVMVDIGKTLLFQAYHCQIAHPDMTHRLAEKSDGLNGVDFVYCPADQIDGLNGLGFDVAINIASMQEMNPESVDQYFGFLRANLKPDNLFYCCNRESKTLVGGEVSDFNRYPWAAEDKVLLDEGCPWHKYFFGTTLSARGPGLLGRRPPIISYYDGDIRHRLAVMATN